MADRSRVAAAASFDRRRKSRFDRAPSKEATSGQDVQRTICPGRCFDPRSRGESDQMPVYATTATAGLNPRGDLTVKEWLLRFPLARSTSARTRRKAN